MVIQWSIVACLVLASSCNAAFISHCQYFGPQCSHRMGDSEEDALLQSNIIGVSFASNVSCGDSPGAATEYCALENPESEPNIDRFQCFSLYRFDKGTKRRILVVAGCIFNHPLSSCTTHTCNFSHEVDLDQGRTNATLHYCCCHTKDDCNRNGIFGNPSTPSAMTSTRRPVSSLANTLATVSLTAKESDTNLSTSTVIYIVVGLVVGLALLWTGTVVLGVYCRPSPTITNAEDLSDV